MVHEIPLTQGYVAIVDDADFEFISQFTWSVLVSESGKIRYARYGVSVDGNYHAITMHRLVMAAPSGVDVDHRDGNGLNNRRDNLRFATKRQNAQNTRRNDLKGAAKAGKWAWACRLSGNGNSLYFGSYRTRLEAARVYDAAATRVYGEFAATNFPNIDPVADAIAESVLSGNPPPTADRIIRSLTEDNAREIRARYAKGGVQCAEFAAEFGVSGGMISHILTRRSWKSIDDGLDEAIAAQAKKARGSNLKNRKLFLSDEQVKSIREKYKPRIVTARMLADEFGASLPCIYGIVNGYSRKEQAA